MVLEVGLLTNTENKNKKRFGGENTIDKRKAITPFAMFLSLASVRPSVRLRLPFPDWLWFQRDLSPNLN